MPNRLWGIRCKFLEQVFYPALKPNSSCLKDELLQCSALVNGEQKPLFHTCSGRSSTESYCRATAALFSAFKHVSEQVAYLPAVQRTKTCSHMVLLQNQTLNTENVPKPWCANFRSLCMLRVYCRKLVGWEVALPVCAIKNPVYGGTHLNIQRCSLTQGPPMMHFTS